MECPSVSLPHEMRAMPRLQRVLTRGAGIEPKPWLREREPVDGYGVFEVEPWVPI